MPASAIPVVILVVAAFAVVGLKRFAHRRPVEPVSSGAEGVPSAGATA